MKKLLSLLMVVASLLTLSACSKEVDNTKIKVAGMKGITSFALAKVFDDDEKLTEPKYETSVITAIDEVSLKLEKKELDIAALPANVASALYNKFDKGITCLNINTYGVLYILSHDDSVKEIKDLEGKTIYTTGKGATPDMSITYLLNENKVNSNLEFKAEATEALQNFLKDKTSVALLPEPFVTVATTKNPDLKIAINLNDEWEKITGEPLVTGTLVVRTEFLNEHKEVVDNFMKDYEAAVKYTNENPAEAAKLIAKYDIVAEDVAAKAIPRANLVNITGSELKDTLSSYLEILYSMNPKSIGGNLPGEEFYYQK